MVRVQENSKLSSVSSASYTTNDLSLEVNLRYPVAGVPNLSEGINHKFGIASNSAPFLVIYGGVLTITFDGPEQALSSLDAYTIKDKWIAQKLVLPVGSNRGLCLHENGLEKDRVSVQDDPKYFYDLASNILKIVLIEGRTETFYTLSDSLIIGVSSGLVSSVYISRLSVK
jgi:hypothetical protein